METINNEINQIINENIDLFKFMKINQSEFKDNMFTNEYKKKLKKAYLSNNRLYHTDKYPDATDEQRERLETLFNINHIIFTILSNEDNYNKFLKIKDEKTHNHNDLKEVYNNLTSELIKDIISSSCEGKTFEESSKEKDIEHSYDRSSEKVIDVKTYDTMVDKLRKKREKMDKKIKLNTNFDINNINNDTNNNFNTLFNRTFEESLNIQKKEENQVVSYNDDNMSLVNTFNYQTFNYGNIYDPTLIDINS